MFRNKKFLKFIAILDVCLVAFVLLVWNGAGALWATWDYRWLDLLHQRAVQSEEGPPASPDVLYLLINDDTYDAFQKNVLDRAYLAKGFQSLSRLGPEAVAFDVIFARPSEPSPDSQFRTALSVLQNVYLPVAFHLSDSPKSFSWKSGSVYEKRSDRFLGKPREVGEGYPLNGNKPLQQMDAFAEQAYNAGHINAQADSDGVYRHFPLLIKTGDRYIPSLPLAMYLDYIDVPFDQVTVEWGKSLRIPTGGRGGEGSNRSIPIDDRGRMYIPYAQVWEKDFPKVSLDRFQNLFQDETMQGNLSDFFSRRFVFVGDVSQGVSDVGQTALEDNVPLIAIHASVFSSLLQNRFYSTWTPLQVSGILIAAGLLLGVAAGFKRSIVYYGVGTSGIVFLVWLSWVEFTRFSLFPAVSVLGGFIFVFGGLVVGLQLAISRHGAFIRNAFSHYVPHQVVTQLLDNPELLKLGGEERLATVLFSDLEGFTTVSEKMKPPQLAALLNEYLTEMTDLVLKHGGIIDKYLGDGIMAEFGIPLPMPDHAERTVRTALEMGRSLEELNIKWKGEGKPELVCRIGVHTGPLVAGNLGSHQVFDYTVVGDAVNLASRLEGVNKLYRTNVIVSESTHSLLPEGMFRTRPLDVIKVKGKSEPVRIFEVYGEMSGSMSESEQNYFRLYVEGFQAYLEKDFEKALQCLREGLAVREQDAPCLNLIQRIEALGQKPLPEGWDGSVALDFK